MLYHYLNAYFQGVIREGRREGPGIIVDSHNNFISSDFVGDRLDGPTFICLHGNLFIFGSFREGRMHGVNTVDSDEYKMVGRYRKGRMVGKGVVIDKRSRKVYVIENEGEEGGGGDRDRDREDEEGRRGSRGSRGNKSEQNERERWDPTLCVVNRYTSEQRRPQGEIENQIGIDISQNEIQQFLSSMMQPVYCCYQSQYQLYFGYVGSSQNLGVTFSPSKLTFSSGIYKEPFAPVTTKFQNLPSHTPNLLHNTVFFPELISIKQDFINTLSFISIFEEKIMQIQNSEIVIQEESMRSEMGIEERSGEFEEDRREMSNVGVNLNSTSRKSVAIEQLNRSLGELLVMQEEMLDKKKRESREGRESRKSREGRESENRMKTKKKERVEKDEREIKEESRELEGTDKQRWLASYYEEEEKLMLRASKTTLKQQLYSYLSHQKSHVIPLSRSKSKSPIKSPRKPLTLKSPKHSKFPKSPKSPKSPTRTSRSPFDTMKIPKSILKNKQRLFG